VIYDPFGNIIAEGGNREGLIIGDVDSAKVAEVRSAMPFLKDRRFYRFSDIKFHKARGRKPSKSYIVVRRRGFRPITQ